jgi:hypothetical protein
MDPLLLAQFDALEDALRALGVAVWPMVDVEADDGLASAAVSRPPTPRRAGDHLHAGQGPRAMRRRQRSSSSTAVRTSGSTPTR